MDKSQAFFSALRIAWGFGYTIAIPIVVLAIVGRILDKKFGTSPWLLVSGIILSIAISSFGLVIKFKQIVKEIEEAGKKDTSGTPQQPTTPKNV